jgi:hypothetical protein
MTHNIGVFQLKETLYGIQFVHDLGFVHADIRGVSSDSPHTLTKNQDSAKVYSYAASYV